MFVNQRQQLTITMSRHGAEHSENMQKEAVIGSLKKELYQLRDKEHQFIPLENEVANIQSKYDMLQDEKERIQSEHRMKLDINRKTILELRQEIDVTNMEVHKSSVHIEEIMREMTALKRTCQNKQSQISAQLSSNQQLNAKNQQLRQQNKSQSMKIKHFKEDRNLGDLECQRIIKQLQDSIDNLKSLEKDARALEALNTKLISILTVAEQDNNELNDEIKSREEVVNSTCKKLEGLNSQMELLREKSRKLEKDVFKSQQDFASVTDNLTAMVFRNKQQAKTIKICQNQLRLIENDLDTAILQRDSLCNEHQTVSTENKILNDDIDTTLMEIMEAERRNGEMQKELERYMVIDEQAREMLNRKEKTFGILTTVCDKLTITGNNIAHLR